MISRSLRGLVAATVLVAGVATVAEAQMETPSRFGIKAGVALPMGDFGDAAGLGIHAGAHLGFGMTENLGLRFDVDYGYYSGDATGLDNVTLLGGVANLVLDIPTESGFQPYVFGGLGMYNWKFEGSGASVDDSDLAFNVGAGYDFTMGSQSWFAELRYLSIQTDGDALNTLPIVIGLRF